MLILAGGGGGGWGHYFQSCMALFFIKLAFKTFTPSEFPVTIPGVRIDILWNHMITRDLIV